MSDQHDPQPSPAKQEGTEIDAATTPAVPARRSDYFGEDVLKDAREAFAETIALKVRQLRRYVPKKKAITNSEVTGNFIEELVRGFVTNWIGAQRLVTGTFYSKASENSEERPLQIDGIVHDPRRGPAILSEGNFELVHPAFCSGVIEIKTTEGDLSAFEKRLQTISGRYMHHVPAHQVMGVVIASPDPVRQSKLPLEGGGLHPLYHTHLAGWCRSSSCSRKRTTNMSRTMMQSII